MNSQLQQADRIFEELLAEVRSYWPGTDLTLLEQAYRVASEAHGTEKRESGEPFMVHPLAAAGILMDGNPLAPLKGDKVTTKLD